MLKTFLLLSTKLMCSSPGASSPPARCQRTPHIQTVVVLVQGHYLSFLPLCSRNEPVFLATCTPVAMPETRECVVQGATNVFTSIHAMDMKFVHIDKK
ncbi:Neuronal PAS [Homalodisca vitripennis]|nr:Neuronal PAS [Homalodisca vitripennis]